MEVKLLPTCGASWRHSWKLAVQELEKTAQGTLDELRALVDHSDLEHLCVWKAIQTTRPGVTEPQILQLFHAERWDQDFIRQKFPPAIAFGCKAVSAVSTPSTDLFLFGGDGRGGTPAPHHKHLSAYTTKGTSLPCTA